MKWHSLRFNTGTTCKIKANGKVIYSFRCRDVDYAMSKASTLMVELGESHTYDFLDTDSQKGRKIIYKGLPCYLVPNSLEPWNVSIHPDINHDWFKGKGLVLTYKESKYWKEGMLPNEFMDKTNYKSTDEFQDNTADLRDQIILASQLWRTAFVEASMTLKGVKKTIVVDEKSPDGVREEWDEESVRKYNEEFRDDDFLKNEYFYINWGDAKELNSSLVNWYPNE